MSYIDELGVRAVNAKKSIATASTNEKNEILRAISKALINNTERIISANDIDMKNAESNGITGPMLDRLKLNTDRIKGMASACEVLINEEDPVGKIISGSVRPNGMQISKVTVPMGVIGIIFESRPNVTVDAATLCIKSGNASILRGGKEAINSNKALMEVMQEAIESLGFDKYIVQLIEDTSHETSTALMRANEYLDLLIPRGGGRLIQAVVNNATVPVIETGTGNCHIYVEKSADFDMAVNIADNGKTQRPGVCNALETLLVDEAVAEEFLPKVKERLDKHNVTFHGCEKTKKILGDCVKDVTEDDYKYEFLDYDIAVKVVKDIDEAIAHIAKYSSGHSEVIITKDYDSARKFQKEVDSACVYVNCSTRFTDGGEFGFGAEIGISTQKLHARGPMGVRELTTTKYLICGNGQIR